MFSLKKISSALLAAAATWTIGGCSAEDASPSHGGEKSEEPALGGSSLNSSEAGADAASAQLEVCEDAPPAEVKLKELTISDFVMVAKQEGAGVCTAYTPCWNGSFALEVPAATAVRFRATDETVPCDQEIRVDLTSIKDAYLEGLQGSEIDLVIDGWGGERVQVK